MDKRGTKEYWSMTEGVFNCLIDKKRTIAFKKAVKDTVAKGDIVVDIGTGSGVLAMFAADAGAKRVYAVEIDAKNIKTLRDTFKINGYENRIFIIKGDATKIKFPEKVDVIICEMIATGLIEELQIPAMNNALKFANKKAKVVLKNFENYIDMVFNNDFYYHKKFKILRYEYPNVNELLSKSFSNKYIYKKVDLSKINIDNKIDKKILLTANKNGVINGIRISSRSIFYNNLSLNASFAYSYPIILPIDDLRVKKGDKFLININYSMCEGFSNFKYSILKK